MKAIFLAAILAIFLSACAEVRNEPASRALPSVAISKGSGFFAFSPMKNPAKPIRVHYYRPSSFTSQSDILLVLPGAGRNGDDYRDMWIGASEKHGILILSPEYPEADFGLADYQYGGFIKNLQMLEPRFDKATSSYHLRDENIRFEFNADRSQWLYNDFDRIFAIAVNSVGAKTEHYDVFGHSAGGQILHRMALFHPFSKARMIVSANAGAYTMPRLDVPLPFGIQNASLDVNSLRQAFRANLVVLLGELDDERETRGIHLRTPNADSWGIGRYQRGRRFFEEGQRAALKMRVPFQWKLQVVPGVGHDAKAMSAAAAIYLYGGS